MYFWDSEAKGWVIQSKNKFDLWFSYLELFLLELLPFFLKGFFKHGARTFFIVKEDKKKKVDE